MLRLILGQLGVKKRLVNMGVIRTCESNPVIE